MCLIAMQLLMARDYFARRSGIIFNAGRCDLMIVAQLD